MRFDPRHAAHGVLVAVATRGVGSQEALAEILARAHDADPRDRGLATELVYGTLRWQLRLDHALTAFAPRGLPADDAPLLAALRIAAYQLLFLPRVPSFSAVDTGVELVKRSRGEGLARFANAVLRHLARCREAPPALPPGDGVDALAVRHSIPAWIVRRLALGSTPDALVARLEAENRGAPLVVRANGLRGDRERLAATLTGEGAEVAPIEGLPGALLVQRPGGIFAGRALADALWLPQDAASQRIVALLAPAPGERVLDLCSGNGVKTTQIAEAVGATGHIDSVDLAPNRIAALRELVARWGVADRVKAFADDVTGPLASAAPTYDRVLLDAPCSALGVLRRRPEVRWRRTDADVRERAALQARLLAAARARVRPGGRLVFAACTFTEEEGPALVRRLLADEPGLRIVRPAPDSPAAPFVDEEGFFRTDPTREEQDAFFAVALETPS